MAAPLIHPGEHLAQELQELGMSAAGLALKLDVPTNRVTDILHGQRAITGDTALRRSAARAQRRADLIWTEVLSRLHCWPLLWAKSLSAARGRDRAHR